MLASINAIDQALDVVRADAAVIVTGQPDALAGID